MIRGRLRSVLVSGAAACIVPLILAGCGPSPKPEPPRTPDPIPTPLYLSDTKALAAAKDAYAKYIAVSNEIGHDGWKDLAPLETVATGEALKSERAAGERNRAKGYHVVGDYSGEVVQLQQIQPSSITVYACLDLTATQIVDAAGVDQTSPNRTDLIPFEVLLKPVDGTLLVGRIDLWSDQSLC